MSRRLVRFTLSILCLTGLHARAELTTPEAHLGFRPGADFHLAKWEQVVSYFRLADAESTRVQVQELGQTTEGRPFVVAVVSAPETIQNLDTYRGYQRLLSHPPGAPDAAAGPALLPPDTDREGLLRDRKSKPVVLITCSIHSSETASTHMAMELLHELATSSDPETLEILDRTILLLVPSVNPDGVDIVADWYPQTLDKPWEGEGLPKLYHKYAGHDTNRDWYMLNLQETRLLTRLLYKQWFPTITYDVHQMGSTGARLFVPPFYDPINPNLDARIHQSIAMIGSHMAADLARAGKRGVLTNTMCDNWWNGGNRTTPQRHHMVGVLTEAASVRLASPIFLEEGDLKGASRGFQDHEPTVNFADPWPGGWWRLRDIVDCKLVCARSILTLAARYGDQFQAQYAKLASEAVQAGKTEPPFGWVVPLDQRDPGRAAELVRILHDTGVEVIETSEPFQVGARLLPAGSWVLPAAQSYRPHLKDMMERQVYPERINGKGEAEPPYDVAGWTLPLLMGVESFTLDEPELPPGAYVTAIRRPGGTRDAGEGDVVYRLDATADDDFRLLNRLLAAEVPVEAIKQEPFNPAAIETWAFQFPVTDETTGLLDSSERELACVVSGASGAAAAVYSLRLPRIGLYQPWVPSMDEGWTRLALEQYEFAYRTLHDAEVKAGRLAEGFDVIILPSVSTSTLERGYKPDASDPRYVGGLGAEGLEALQAFVEQGGTLICLESSCRYVLDHWDLARFDALRDLKSSEFYCPGSILNLRTRVGGGSPDSSKFLLAGYPERSHAFFNRSLAFDVDPDSATSSTRVLATYAGNDVLASGWLLGESHIADKAAVVEVESGKGKILPFGFPPQHRAQTRGTFRLLFNALLRAGAEGAQPAG